MFIDTSSPELAQFDPEKQGAALPPVGVYPATYQVVASAQGQTKTGFGKFDITYTAIDGEIAGQQFLLTYNVGHSTADVAKWAVEDVLRVVYAITGIKEHGRGFQFDDKMNNKPFSATLIVTEQVNKSTGQPITDDNGKAYRNARFNSLKPIDVSQPQQQQQQPAQQAQYASAPVQSYQNQGQPQQQDKPSWAAK